MRVHFWGTRGTFPQTSEEYREYGGNTSCVSVECSAGLVIFDAGTGLETLGRWMKMEEARDDTLKSCPIHLFLSHVHLDHVLGLAQFLPLYDAGREVIIYGEDRVGLPLEAAVSHLIAPPYWPLAIQQMQADVKFRSIRNGSVLKLMEVGSGETHLSGEHPVSIAAFSGNHPDGVLHYRLDEGNHSIFYGLDCEMNETVIETMSRNCRGCSLLITDAQYTQQQLETRRGWGHSSWKEGIRLRALSGAEQLICMHYDCTLTDTELRIQEKLAQQEDSCCRFAKEGMEVIYDNRKTGKDSGYWNCFVRGEEL